MKLSEWSLRRSKGIAPDQVLQVRLSLDAVVRALGRFGVSAVPYRDTSLKRVAAMGSRDISWILANWQGYASALNELADQHPELSDASGNGSGSGALQTRALLWRMLARLGYTPRAEVLELIQDQDIVEIYDFQGRQLFRSLRFFEFSSFSLEELFTGDWTSLTTRDVGVVQQMASAITMIALGITNTTLQLSGMFREHLVTETVGEKRSFFIHLRYASPLKQKGLPLAFVVIQRPRWP